MRCEITKKPVKKSNNCEKRNILYLWRKFLWNSCNLSIKWRFLMIERSRKNCQMIVMKIVSTIYIFDFLVKLIYFWKKWAEVPKLNLKVKVIIYSWDLIKLKKEDILENISRRFWIAWPLQFIFKISTKIADIEFFSAANLKNLF